MRFKSNISTFLKNVLPFYPRIISKIYQLIALIKILNTKPIVTKKESNILVSSITSHKDYVFLILSVKSFYLHSGIKFSLTIFDDGSLTKKDINTLKKHLINCEVITKQKYVSKIEKKYGKSHIFYQKRNIPYVIKKIGPFLFSTQDKIIFLDSDVLFFKQTKEIQDWINGKYDAFYIQDHQDAYFLSQIESKTIFNTKLLPKLNSGFLGINRKDIKMDIFKKLLETYDTLSVYRPWQFQTFFALTLSSKRCLALPKSYLISEVDDINPNTICCHYVRTIRHKIYQDYHLVIKNLNSRID